MEQNLATLNPNQASQFSQSTGLRNTIYSYFDDEFDEDLGKPSDRRRKDY